MPETPAALGYRMPAEWEPHAGTWLSWPHNRATWPGQFEPIPGVWAELVRTLAPFEPVHISAGGEAVMAEAQRLVGDVPNVTLHDIPTNDAWARDHGPLFLVGPPGAPPALVHWGFNAWGRKYPRFDLDQRVPERVAETTGYRRFEPGIILEGGAVDFNGCGAVLTTEQCVLHENRNPGISKADIERHLADYCAVRHVIWLSKGIVGDDTDGHIDEVARFVGPRTVVAAVAHDSTDPNYGTLRDNLAQLHTSTDEQGRPLEIIELPMPGPTYYKTTRLPVSYTNFYIANGVVIVPQFEDPADAAAIDTLAKLFPDRQIRGLPAKQLAWGLGTYHCITQQQARPE